MIGKAKSEARSKLVWLYAVSPMKNRGMQLQSSLASKGFATMKILRHLNLIGLIKKIEANGGTVIAIKY